jgi:hypothetical protein
VINSDDVNSDFLILHEYAHYLEEMISAFAPIPATHNGCTANLFGFNVTWPEHAWMEGFADYFAQAVGRSVPPGTFTGISGTLGTATLESPSCSGLPNATIPGDFVELLVAGTLWDVFDQPGDPNSLNEAQDTLARMDREIFQIFDRELDQVGLVSGRSPAITDFRDAWMARGLPGVGLSRIMVTLGLPLRSNYSPAADAGQDQTVSEGTMVTLDGRASRDPDLNPLNFAWTQVSGPTVTLLNSSSATPSFTAPQLGSGSTALVFRLVVSDGSAPPSAPDDVTVQVVAQEDTTAPQTTITSGPSGTVRRAGANFSFTSSEVGSTFECRRDGSAWSSCTSPTRYANLRNGTHVFQVRAKDAAGNVDPTPATRRWTVRR